MITDMHKIVTAGLRAGFGVEDIALSANVPVDLVRSWVRTMRRQGELTKIYGQTARTTAPKETPQ